MMRMVSRGGTEGGQAGARAPPQDIFIFKKEMLYFFILKRWVYYSN